MKAELSLLGSGTGRPPSQGVELGHGPWGACRIQWTSVELSGEAKGTGTRRWGSGGSLACLVGLSALSDECLGDNSPASGFGEGKEPR